MYNITLKNSLYQQVMEQHPPSSTSPEPTHPLKIPVILSSLFAHVTLPDLKTARLVSKLWHYEATHFLLLGSKITIDFKPYITCDKTARLANLALISSLPHLSPQEEGGTAPTLEIKLPQFITNLLPELQLDSPIKPCGESIANVGHEIETLFDPGPEIWETLNYPEITPWSRIHFILQDVQLLLTCNSPQLREVILFAPINTDSTYALFLAVLRKLGVLPRLEKLEVTIVFGMPFFNKLLLQDVPPPPEMVIFNSIRTFTISIIHDPKYWTSAKIFLQGWIPHVVGGMGGRLNEIILKLGSDLDTLFLHDVQIYYPNFYTGLRSISILHSSKDLFQWVRNLPGFVTLTKLEVATRPEMEPDLEKDIETLLIQHSVTLKSFEVRLHRPRGEKNLAIKLPKLAHLEKLRISIGAGNDGTWSKDWVRRGRQDCGVESDRTSATVTFYSDQVNHGVEVSEMR